MVGAANEELGLAASLEKPKQRVGEVALERLSDEDIVFEVED